MDYTNPSEATRAKFYLKLLCQWTSPGVAKTTGNHLIDYLYCPDQQLGETFKHPEGLERGITRQEITIYGGRLPPLNELIDKLDEQYNFVDAPIFYYVPACNLWRNITDQITNNLIIYDKVERILLIAYYVNLQTRKATTIRKKLNKDYTTEECERILKYVIAHYSYKLLPCNVIITEKQQNEDIKLTLKTYRKLYGDTQLGKPISFFTSLKELTNKGEKKEVDIEQTGFKETTFIKWFIPEKTQNMRSVILYPDIEEYKYTEEDAKNGIYQPQISTKSVEDRRTLQAKLEYENAERQYKQENEEHRKHTLDYYNELKKQTTEIIKQKKQ